VHDQIAVAQLDRQDVVDIQAANTFVLLQASWLSLQDE
jgi:hypothetical protein